MRTDMLSHDSGVGKRLFSKDQMVLKHSLVSDVSTIINHHFIQQRDLDLGQWPCTHNIIPRWCQLGLTMMLNPAGTIREDKNLQISIALWFIIIDLPKMKTPRVFKTITPFKKEAAQWMSTQTQFTKSLMWRLAKLDQKIINGQSGTSNFLTYASL